MAWSTVKSDAFTSSAMRLSTYNAGWVEVVFGTNNRLYISSNAVYKGEGDGTPVSYWNGTFSEDQASQITMLNPSTRAGGVYVRITDKGSGLWDGYYVFYNGSVILGKTVDGSSSTLQTTTNTLADNDVLRLEATGTTSVELKVFKNGTQINTTYTDASSALRNGKPGIVTNSVSDTTLCLDDFVGDEWTADVATFVPQVIMVL